MKIEKPTNPLDALHAMEGVASNASQLNSSHALNVQFHCRAL